MKPVLKDKIAEMLRKEIYLGNIADGDSFTQELISEKLGVSRMPVREAFLQLEADGVLERLKNRHVKVIGMTRHRIRQFFSALCALEVSFANGLPSADEVIRTFEAYRAAVPHQGKATCMERLLDFHLSLSDALDNPSLYQLHRRMLMGYPRFLYNHLDFDWKKLLKHHEAIFTAIESRDKTAIASTFEAYYNELADRAVEECSLGELETD